MSLPSDTDKSWNFDVSSFMVLLGEGQELTLRQMRRSYLECLSAAPVAGLQSYLHSSFQLAEALGPDNISIQGVKKAPLRNQRTANLISAKKMLRNGYIKRYRIKPRQKKTSDDNRNDNKRSQMPIVLETFWVILTWVVLGAIFFVLSWCNAAGHTSWKGIVPCFRMKRCTNTPTKPDEEDQIVILGPRNSCVVFEGTRRDVNKWSGLGVELGPGARGSFIGVLMWGISLVLLIAIFAIVPNGTTWDQVAWITLNILGQMNVLVCQWLNVEGSLTWLEEIHPGLGEVVKTRTDVYGYLLEEFGNGEWVDEMELLPKTELRRRWRHEWATNSHADVKLLYDCYAKEMQVTSHNEGL
ncbi:hypothetical protein HYALB_00009625 [Hymenoscyphus albidus]|uniref:Uncharacterized protein n=1 Tax=Hymenoscyphus albidus TaxID=595503 RepID=A0A9N9LR73_9HELO|nr:hypothetical protein HYALB_00009625 [Hymenoscyphus albidus]